MTSNTPKQLREERIDKGAVRGYPARLCRGCGGGRHCGAGARHQRGLVGGSGRPGMERRPDDRAYDRGSRQVRPLPVEPFRSLHRSESVARGRCDAAGTSGSHRGVCGGAYRCCGHGTPGRRRLPRHRDAERSAVPRDGVRGTAHSRLRRHLRARTAIRAARRAVPTRDRALLSRSGHQQAPRMALPRVAERPAPPSRGQRWGQPPPLHERAEIPLEFGCDTATGEWRAIRWATS